MSDLENKDEKVMKLLPKLPKGLKPKFAPGTEFSDRVLAYDMSGVGWWIDPYARTIEKVTIIKGLKETE